MNWQPRLPTRRRLALLVGTFAATAALSAAVVTSAAAAQEPSAGRAAPAVKSLHLTLPAPTRSLRGRGALGLRLRPVAHR